MTLKFIISAFILIVVLVSIGYWAGLQNFFLAAIADPSAKLFEKISLDRLVLNQVREFKVLAQKNRDLELYQQELLSRLARLEELDKENEFLRRSLNIKVPPSFTKIHGSIFSLSSAPSGFQVLLNKGSNDGVAVEDIVITNEQVLVGIVQEVQPSFSKVKLTNSPGSEIMGRILGASTTGIVQGNADGFLHFELIVEGEDIKEGDVVVSSGRDNFPASLILGKVEHIQSDGGTLFQDVRIKPAFEYFTGRVIIFHHQ